VPYASVADVPDYVPEKHRAQWRAVWNSCYQDALDDGKSKEKAEASAFAQANGVAGPNVKKTECPLCSATSVVLGKCDFCGYLERKVFVVGKVVGDSKDWEFQGVFTNFDLAKAACLEKNYFVGPAELDRRLPTDSMEWEGVVWPKV